MLSYDRYYRNSYSYSSQLQNALQWDYAYQSWKQIANPYIEGVLQSSTDNCQHPTVTDDINYTKTIEQVAPTPTPFDGTASYYYYNPYKSKFYSSTLREDRSSNSKSYDYTYRNSYSYRSWQRRVFQWDYAYDQFNTTRPLYTGNQGNGFWSTYLTQDRRNPTKSYDNRYLNSYSYRAYDQKVLQWDYTYLSWKYDNFYKG